MGMYVFFLVADKSLKKFFFVFFVTGRQRASIFVGTENNAQR